jgi:hypothetical protein
MKRPLWFLVAFAAVVLAGCNQGQIADLILVVGFHPAFNGAGDCEPSPASVSPAVRQSFEQLLSAMSELRALRTARSGAADGTRIRRLIDQIQASSDELVNGNGLSTQAECRQVREVEFAAWTLAAELAPADFSAPRENFRATHFPNELMTDDASDASALRILGEYLTAKQMPPHAHYALKLHAISYPNCPLNVQLFGTMAERLANEKQLDDSIQVATDGVQLCAHLPGVQKLQGQVEHLRATKSLRAN